MSALFELVVVDKIRVRLLCPTLRCFIELISKDAYGNRDGDAFNSEEGSLVFPIDTRRRNRCVRRPEERDVVEHNANEAYNAKTKIVNQ